MFSDEKFNLNGPDKNTILLVRSSEEMMLQRNAKFFSKSSFDVKR